MLGAFRFSIAPKQQGPSTAKPATMRQSHAIVLWVSVYGPFCAFPVNYGEGVICRSGLLWGRIARCARAVHEVCTRPYPNCIVVPSINNNEPCCAFI